MTERQYQHTLANLSRYLLVVEQQMTAKQWEEIDYQRVPSRANLQYNSAFLRHDEDLPTRIPGCCGERRGQDQRFCSLPA